MEKPYFSIVMPVYNGESYVETMLQAIRRQTCTDWEMIVVDDCSTDRSREIVRHIVEQDSRVRLICMENNAGVSAARNRGIQEASGQYLWFVDTDDSVDAALLEMVRESLQKQPAKLVIFGLIEEYYDARDHMQYSHKVSHEERYFRTKEALRPEMIYLEQETLYGYPWNKIYELEYLKKGRFRFADYKEAKFIEDIKFNIEYCMDIDTLNILDFCPYHYAKRVQKNLTNEFAKDYFKFHKKRIEMLFDQYTYWNLCGEEVREILGSLYARYILSALQRNCDKRSEMNHAKRYRWCRGLFSQGLFNELIPIAKAKDSKALSLLLLFLRWKKTFICLAMGRSVYIIKNKLPMFYSKVKSGR